ncbi:ArsR/SmtB family transcription factor [Phytoactinopolyspora mesophila]|uniref:Helix-turn-helix domain-containing protein n=1 Tax=Phytoactinopolyspora mesophila TaxID=2650750 RepID=A0A7K3M5D5_9ACTN|nr:DUF5937 family protein [Phytoactinopolyspora mesophila]NDL58524.1 helix-turn-helix domain-containing protein [Phytoactinopolyspora mesophila]
MLQLAFSPQDVALTRLAFSPLWEAVASVRVLQNPAAHTLHLPWVKRVRPLLDDARADLSLFTGLTSPYPQYLPGFLAPTPTTPTPDLATELASLRETDPHDVRQAVASLRNVPAAATLLDDPAAGLRRLSTAIESYWELVLEPWWPRIRNLLEGDVLYRARSIADGGAHGLLDDLDPAIRWREGVLSVAHASVADTRQLAGRGLVLVPSVFVWPRVASKTSPPWQPVLRYPARGIATLWENGTGTPGSLSAVVGRTRATLLTELAAPASTTELAQRTSLSAGGVSQHLSALRAAGLVAGHRVGRTVLYVRTPLGDGLARPGDAMP